MADVSPADLRAADADREAVAEVLRQAGGDGRLEPDELDERLTGAYAARTFGELRRLVADLPGARPPGPTAVVRADERPLRITAGGANQKREGAWSVPSRIVVEPKMSDVKLDFRSASCPHERVELEVNGGVGSILLVLPDGWSVDLHELRTSWGSTRNRHEAPAAAGKPTIAVSGGIGMGTFKTRGPHFYER